MSHLFRLCYYLRRSGEKQPLLLLEPISRRTSGEYFLPETSPRTSPEWYLYTEGGACKAIELRKLHSVHKSQGLLRELQALSDKSPRELAKELEHLWQGSIKGIALRQLAQGQIIASEGVWLVSERSFYALLPCSLWHNLGDHRTEQRIELTERSTGHVKPGFLAVVETFSELLLCRLSLERRSLISLTQPQDGSLYSLSFVEDRIPSDIFLFAPVSNVASSSALRKFLQARLGLSAQLDSLQDLAANFIGWGEHRADRATHTEISTGCTWVQLGAWRIQRKLLQKHGAYIEQRARQFGGYPIDSLLTEQALPQALFKSLLNYLCDDPPLLPEPSKDTLRASCQKVDGYLFSREALYTPGGAELPRHISPQGRKILQDLVAAGEGGVPLFRLQREQSEVLQALLRSGWAIQKNSRYYAACYCETGKLQDQSVDTDLTLILASYKRKNELRQKQERSACQLAPKRSVNGHKANRMDNRPDKESGSQDHYRQRDSRRNYREKNCWPKFEPTIKGRPMRKSRAKPEPTTGRTREKSMLKQTDMRFTPRKGPPYYPKD